MESLAADCSDSNNNNNNNSEERTTTTDLCTVPLLFREFSTLEHKHPAPSDADDLPDAELFIAEPTILKTLTGEHGFSGVAARKALYWTRNESLESALDWLCERSESTYETPLEDELDQLKEEFETMNQRALARLAARNPGIACSISSTLDIGEIFSSSEEETEEEELELVVILNSRSRKKMDYSQWILFVQEAVRDIVYNISLTSAATDKLDSWENGSNSEVLIGWAEGSPHMIDLDLCARSLSLHTGVAGLHWDSARLVYKEYMALAVWGDSAEVQQAVGRLIPVSARK